jgi:hypothetical protein
MARPTQHTSIDDGARRFDLRALLRLALWGTSAAAALMLAVLAGYPHFTAQHLIALPPWASTLTQRQAGVVSAPSAQRAIETDGETENLAAAVRGLGADRDALLRRITTLEQGLEDVTGSINRRLPAATPGASAAILPAQPAVAAPVVRETQVAAPVLPAPTQSTASRFAALPAIEGRAEAAVPPVAKGKFAIDLGSAVNFDALRVLWNATKAGNAPLLDGLTPLVRVRENGKSGAPELRLVVGPLAGAEMAAKLCGVLIASRSCQPAAFEGQQFAQSVPEPETKLPPLPERRPPRPAVRPPPPRANP